MSVAETGKLLIDSQAVNPRTGKLWRLNDPEVQPRVDKLLGTVKNQADALEYLKQNGFLTPTGRLQKKYGG